MLLKIQNRRLEISLPTLKIDLIVGKFECFVVALAAFSEVTLNDMRIAHQHLIPSSGPSGHLELHYKLIIFSSVIFYLQRLDGYIKIEEIVISIFDILYYVVTVVQVRYDFLDLIEIAKRVFQRINLKIKIQIKISNM